MPTKTIRIDDDIYTYLEENVRTFGDTPNSVLRRLLGFDDDDGMVEEEKPDEEAEGLVGRLAEEAGLPEGTLSRTANPLRYRLRAKSGKVVAYIRKQKTRFRLSTPKTRASDLGLDGWDSERATGWFGNEPAVFWYLRDSDEAARDEWGHMLKKLYES